MRSRTVAALILLTALVTGAHVALWASPRVPAEAKLRLTILNAAGWGVVLLPAAGVAAWARAHRRRATGAPPPATVATPAGLEPAAVRLEGECSIR